jgi:hypothetical protein
MTLKQLIDAAFDDFARIAHNNAGKMETASGLAPQMSKL